MELEMERDVIEVTRMPEYATVHKVTGKKIPVVYRSKYWCFDCGDFHNEYTFDRRYSSKNFVEKWIGGGDVKEFVPGLTHFYIDGNEVTKEQFDITVRTIRGMKYDTKEGSEI